MAVDAAVAAAAVAAAVAAAPPSFMIQTRPTRRYPLVPLVPVPVAAVAAVGNLAAKPMRLWDLSPPRSKTMKPRLKTMVVIP